MNHVSKDYGYKEYLETLLTHDKLTAESRLEAQGFFVDKTKLRNVSENSNTIELYGKINLVNVDRNRYLLPLISLNLKLHIGNPDCFIVEDQT